MSPMAVVDRIWRRSIGLAVYGVAGLRLLAPLSRACSPTQRSDDASLRRALAQPRDRRDAGAAAGLGDLRHLGCRRAARLFRADGAVRRDRGVRAVPRRSRAGGMPRCPSRISPTRHRRAEPAPHARLARAGRALGGAVARRAAGRADPGLCRCATLARRLGTNTSLSVARAERGLGRQLLRLRQRPAQRAVAAAIARAITADLLDLALDAGFASKASFNRAFLASLRQSPVAPIAGPRRKSE